MKKMFLSIILLTAFYGSHAQSTPVLYLNFASHNEDGSAAGTLNYLNNSSAYLANRNLVVKMGVAIHAKGAKWNLGSDWNFLKAVAQYDVDNVTSNTNGKNVINYLVNELGVEADAHSHEKGGYTYADVAYLHTLLGVNPSNTASGFIFYPASVADWEKHEQGTYSPLSGNQYFYKPDNIWGAAASQHTLDDQSYGMWKPQDKNNFYVHDASNNLAYIGGGCFDVNAEPIDQLVWIKQLLTAIQNGSVNQNGFYCATLMFNQAELTDDLISQVSILMDSINYYVGKGQIEWKSFTEIGTTWRNTHNSNASQLSCSDVPVTVSTVTETMEVYPNPFTTSFKVRYTTSTSEQVSIKFYTANGVLKGTIFNGIAPAAGSYEVAYNVPKTFKSGNYLVVYNSPVSTISVQVSKK